ncbi:Asp/Glu racemase [Oricola sp.]|uniref:maleate cis-trans isomerase family protein n=1 Tax=Oricola sp. TaxID=1979950 RepID=UPI0025FF8FA5|nr:Asp/Glu racemase [Oricola sp.]MCI5076903.1 Asp/Glu racemase [Oricola sp.]
MWQIAKPGYDEGVGACGSIGLIALSVDRAFESDIHDFIGDAPGVGIFTTRIAMEPVASPESLAALEGHLDGCARLLVPGTKLDVVAFGCTSGAIAIGLDKVAQIIRNARPGVEVATPIGAAVKAFEVLGAKRISLLAPYRVPVAEMVAAHFEAEGLVIDRRMTFDLDGDPDINRLSVAALVEEGKRAMHEDSDALFISCTGLRTAGVVETLERELGKPVVTSNQALAWQCMRLLSGQGEAAGIGSLNRTGAS